MRGKRYGRVVSFTKKNMLTLIQNSLQVFHTLQTLKRDWLCMFERFGTQFRPDVRVPRKLKEKITNRNGIGVSCREENTDDLIADELAILRFLYQFVEEGRRSSSPFLLRLLFSLFVETKTVLVLGKSSVDVPINHGMDFCTSCFPFFVVGGLAPEER